MYISCSKANLTVHFLLHFHLTVRYSKNRKKKLKLVIYRLKFPSIYFALLRIPKRAMTNVSTYVSTPFVSHALFYYLSLYDNLNLERSAANRMMTVLEAAAVVLSSKRKFAVLLFLC